jgi:ankyrin repeat protein
MNPEWDVLLSASQKNRPDLIREYVTHRGMDPSHANAVGQSALHIAALWGHGTCQWQNS